MIAKIIRVLEEEIKPVLKLHGGDIEILDFNEGKSQLKLRLLGQCCVCPNSIDTIENIIVSKLKTKVKDLKNVTVETGLSDEMLLLAKQILKNN